MLSLPCHFGSRRPLGNLATSQSPVIEPFGLEALREAKRETSPVLSQRCSGFELTRLLSNDTKDALSEI